MNAVIKTVLLFGFTSISYGASAQPSAMGQSYTVVDTNSEYQLGQDQIHKRSCVREGKFKQEVTQEVNEVEYFIKLQQEYDSKSKRTNWRSQVGVKAVFKISFLANTHPDTSDIDFYRNSCLFHAAKIVNGSMVTFRGSGSYAGGPLASADYSFPNTEQGYAEFKDHFEKLTASLQGNFMGTFHIVDGDGESSATALLHFTPESFGQFAKTMERDLREFAMSDGKVKPGTWVEFHRTVYP